MAGYSFIAIVMASTVARVLNEQFRLHSLPEVGQD
jgi:hypothetical protein